MKLRGYRIDIIRAEAGLTVTELAKVAGCSPETVQKARHDKEVSIMAAGRIAKALKIPLEQLAADPEEQTQRGD